MVALSQLQDIPPRNLTLLVGPPGAGKSTFCQQAILSNIEMRPVLYATTESAPSNVEDSLREKGRGRILPHPLAFVDAFHETMGLPTVTRTDAVASYDIRMKGVNFLRNKYVMAELCIRQKEKADIYDFMEDILRSKGYAIDKELLRRAIAKPHRTVCSPINYEEERRTAIRDGFMEMLRKELLDPSLEQEIREQSLRGY